jgi:hypothetical protein
MDEASANTRHFLFDDRNENTAFFLLHMNSDSYGSATVDLIKNREYHPGGARSLTRFCSVESVLAVGKHLNFFLTSACSGIKKNQ